MSIIYHDSNKQAKYYHFIDLNKIVFILKGLEIDLFKPVEFDGFRIHTIKL